MKLKHILVENFLGVHSLSLDTSAPVQLIVGPNGAGKSSTRDAIALALTADLGRVSLKKEAAQLVRDGATAAVCEVTTADGDPYVVSITRSGKISDKAAGREPDPALPYVLDAQRFARLSDTERRAFLFGLMGVKTTSAAVKDRLTARGADQKRIEAVLPLLRSGFDAACKEAKGKATEAKGAWRAITGETYGSDKAKTWRAEVPTFDAAALQRLVDAQRRSDEAIAQAQAALGKGQAELQRRQQLQASLPDLEAHVGRLVRLRSKLATDEAELQRAEQDLVSAQAAAGGAPRVGLVHDLAKGLKETLFFVGAKHEFRPHWEGLLARYEQEHGPISADQADPEAAARVPKLQAARDLMASAVANGKRDIDAALQAQGKLEEAKQQLAKDPFDKAAFEELQGNLGQLQGQRAQRQTEIDRLLSLQQAALRAARQTEDARKHADDVAGWELIGDALSPDGIQAEMLAEALGPLNARLEQAALDTGWPRVEIGADMLVRAAGRDYRLLSESERWRCDAMLAEAISNLSRLGLLVLDRFDVLDLSGRSDLLGWLDVLADAGEIGTALVFGTLKQLPSSLPATTRAHWIQDGATGQLKEAA